MKVEFTNPPGWWEFRDWLPVELEKRFIQHAVNAQATLHDHSPELLEALTSNAEDLVIACTLKWSYSDEVSLRVLHEEVPAPHYREVGDRMGDLYAPLVSNAIEAGQRAYSSALSLDDQKSRATS